MIWIGHVWHIYKLFQKDLPDLARKDTAQTGCKTSRHTTHMMTHTHYRTSPCWPSTQKATCSIATALL